jgi:hypothetical protein
MPGRNLGRLIIGAAGPVALTVTTAMASPAAASTSGPGVPSVSNTFQGCTYYAYKPILSGSTQNYAKFWAGFNCPTHIGYSLDIYVQKSAIGSNQWATPNTPSTHLNFVADNPTNYYDYLGADCAVISSPAPYRIRTKAVMSVGAAGGPGSTAIYGPEVSFPANAIC